MITCKGCGAEFDETDRRAFHRHIYVCGGPTTSVPQPAPPPIADELVSMRTVYAAMLVGGAVVLVALGWWLLK